MTKYMDKEDIKALELINNEVEDPILKSKLIKIYIQSIIKEKHYRERHRCNQVSLDYESSEAYLAMVELSVKQKSIESIFDDQESKKELYKAIHELDVDEQKLIWLFFFCNLTTREVAITMNLHQTQVIRMKKKALKKIKNKIFL